MTNPRPLMHQYNDIGKMISEDKESLAESKRETKNLKEGITKLRLFRRNLSVQICDEVFNHE